MAANAPATSVEFLELVQKSGVLPPDRVQALLALDALPEVPTKAATALVKNGFLTKFQAAQLLAGRHKGFRIGAYVVQDQLGRGGMGAVYLAEHLELHRKVAIKVLTATGKGEEQKLALERFLREARAAAALDHPNIVRIFDVARHNDAPYLVMEFVDGETLQQVIDRDGAVPYSIAAEYVSQAAAGLQHAHEKGFVHRDIKPGNLMRDRSGTIKILDMGLARSASDQDKLTEQLDQGAVVGTADFIAPEQAINSPDVDSRADIYSLGATFFSLIIGKPPFGGNTTQKLLQHQLKSAPTLASLDTTLPKGLSAVVARMLAKKPEQRFQTPAEVIAALAPWTGNSARVLAGLSRTNLGQGADLHAALMDRSHGGSSLVLRAPGDPATDSSVVDPSAPGSTTDAISASETLRNHPHRPAEPKAATKLDKLLKSPHGVKYLVGAGVGLLLLVALGVWLGFRGGKDDDTAQNPPVVNPQPQPPPPSPPQPQPKPPQPKPPTPPVVTPTPPKVEPREEPVFQLDPAKVAPFQVRMKGGTVAEGKRGALPPGVSLLAINDAEAQFSAGPVEGVPALGLTRLSPTGGVQAAFELEKDPAAGGVGAKLAPGESYRLRIEYRAAAGVQMGVGVHTPQYKPVAEYKVFPSSGERWQTAEVAFDRGADPVRFVIENRTAGAARTLSLRAVTLVRVVKPVAVTPAVQERTRFTLDLAGQQPFVIRSGLSVDPNDAAKRIYRLVSHTGEGKLPQGWSARCWNKDSEMEAFAETVEGRPVLGTRNVSGPGSAMLLMPRFECPSGHCKLRIEYAADVKDKAFTIRFKPGDQRPAFDVARPAVGTGWRTEELTVNLKGANDGYFEFHNGDSRPGSAVRIRALTVVEPDPTSPDRVVFKLDAFDLPGFRNAKLGRKKTSGEDDPKIKGVYFGGWKPESESEWVCGPVAGAKAIGITNHNDVVSAQIGIDLESANGVGLSFAPGQIVRLQVTYRTSGKGRGGIYFQNIDDRKVYDRATLTTSNTAWRTVEVVTTRGANPLRCLVDSSEKGAGNTLFVKSVVVSEVGKPGPPPPPPALAVTPANDPANPANWAEGAKVYTLDVGAIPEFRVQKEKGKRTGGEPEKLPAGIGCQCWKDGAVGEFRRDTLAGVPALGLTNLNDEKSGQFYFALEGAMKLSLEPGKAYRVKVGYRTDNDATASVSVQVVPGYKGLASARLPAKTEQWKAAAASFVRPPAADKVELRLSIDNTAVGEGNTVWVRSLEIVELIPPKK